MANPLKGEIELKAGDKVYTLHYSFGALVSLEEKVGKGFPMIAKDLGDPEKITLKLVREVLHTGLADFHKDITIEQAGELIPEAGGTLTVLSAMDKAMSYAFARDKGDKPQDPPKEAPKKS